MKQEQIKRLFLTLLLGTGSCFLITGALNPFCGDGFIQEGEQCDDGNDINTDACVTDEATGQTCIIVVCGDGNTGPGEECDDGNESNTDDCVTNDAGDDCVVATCGDGNIQDEAEACDDGNLANNDGCNSFCEIEANSTCDGSPSTCTRATIDQIEAGSNFNCAFSDAGGVHCWGAAGEGQLGYGNNNNIGDSEPPSAVGIVDLGLVAIASVSSGDFHSCALLTDGDISCWGRGADGALGYGNLNAIGNDEPPSLNGVVNDGVVVRQVVAGGAHTCALFDPGAVKCWGKNSNGQLGYGNINNIGDDEEPDAVGAIDLDGASAKQLILGGSHTCVLLTTDLVRCWGKNDFGQLGLGISLQPGKDSIGDTADESTQNSLVPIGVVKQMTAGADHSCAIRQNNTVTCWGLNTDGQLGLGNAFALGDDEAVPINNELNFGGGVVVQISAGNSHTCAVFGDGSAKCWGKNNTGQLGRADLTSFGNDANETLNVLEPIVLDVPIASISAGGDHTCALLSNDQIRCWGEGDQGMLGDVSTTDVSDPNSVSDISFVNP